MGFDRLLDIIKKAQSRYPAFSKRLTEAEALSRWDTAVGPAIAKHSRAIRVQDGVLLVEVDHPIWKAELHHRKRQILEILNQGRPQTETKRELKPAKETLSDIWFVDIRH
jgi:predicted nucleic acid-binding Zn ribbon protein